MSLLSDLKTLIEALDIPVETGKFSGKPPDEYIVMVPIHDDYELYADDLPGADVQSVRLSLYTKGSYIRQKNRVLKALLLAGIIVTDRLYIEFEQDTGYHHYNIDVEDVYDVNLETEE